MERRMGMNVVFRVDASIKIGSGHVMRCMTLAEELREQGANIIFICAELPGHLFNLIEANKFTLCKIILNQQSSLEDPWDTVKDIEQTIAILTLLGEFPDWVVVDHYQLDYLWEQKIRPFAHKIMVIDDLADRKHDCDLLLDQNLYHSMQSRYEHLVPEYCQKLLGPGFVLLRKEFKDLGVRKRSGNVKKLLVFFGGSDPTNETLKVLHAFDSIKTDKLSIDVVVGNSNPNKECIKDKCNTMQNVSYYCQINNMAELMNDSDLSIGAGGTSTWERCYLGLPSIVITVATNQEESISVLHTKGAVWNLGKSQEVTEKHILEAVEKIISQPQLINDLSRNATKIMEHHKDVSFYSILTKIRKVNRIG
jgi:UDP-2,4-diacetamido-2,4,6-trideoxy-beta-L-altropyranose hydrolase